jgi:hypothetical protein
MDVVIFALLFVVAIAVFGTQTENVKVNGRSIPAKPFLQPVRGFVVIALLVVLAVALIVGTVRDAIWPRGPRWVKWRRGGPREDEGAEEDEAQGRR